MKKLQMGCQCALQKGSANLVAWIPTQFAVVNKVIDLQKEDGTWDENWKVVSCWSVMPMAEVREHQRISLPSIAQQ